MNSSTCSLFWVAPCVLAFSACSGTDPSSEADAGANPAATSDRETIQLTEAKFAEAETAKNFRNWAARGANEGLAHMRELPPRGDAAPTIQMNDDTLYSVAITEVQDGSVTFTIPRRTSTWPCR